MVTIPERVLFDFDRSEIRADAAPTLAKVGEVVRFHATKRVDVRGHTDSVGSDEYNQGLSERRAAAVKTYLVQNLTVEADRVNAQGFGEKMPVASNDNDDGRQRNRRVEIVIADA